MVHEPVMIGSPEGEGVLHGFSLAVSHDGVTIAAGWNDLATEDVPLVAASADGGETFAEAVHLDTASNDVMLSSMQLLLPDSGLFAGVVAHALDPKDNATHNWPRLYASSDQGASFATASDLQSLLGARMFSQAAFASSPDGKTVVCAWVDTTPAEWLGPDSPPTQAVLATVSEDSGKTFGKPEVVSAIPFVSSTRIAAFVRDGHAGVVFAESRTIPGEPTPVGVAVMSLAGDDGKFQAPVNVAPDEYGAVPLGGASGVDGTAPGAAVGPDGSIHVVWWSALTVGLWYAVSMDGTTFSAPVEVLMTETPTPANVRVSVDGSGTVWVAALDHTSVRVVEIPPGEAPVEMEEAEAPLGGTGDTFDIAGLPDRGAAVLWLGAPPETDMMALPAVQIRHIAP